MQQVSQDYDECDTPAKWVELPVIATVARILYQETATVYKARAKLPISKLLRSYLKNQKFHSEPFALLRINPPHVWRVNSAKNFLFLPASPFASLRACPELAEGVTALR